MAADVFSGGDSRRGGANVSQLPLQVLLQLLEALERDLELVRCVEGRRVIADRDVQ